MTLPLLKPRVVPVTVVIPADVPLSCVIAPEAARIVEDADVPIVVPVRVVMSADVPVRVVMAPDAPRSCVVAVVPKVVPVKVVISAEVDFRLSIVALVDLSVVIVAEVNVALLSVRLDTVRLDTDRLVMSADAALTCVVATVPNVVPVSVVILAEAMLAAVIDALP